MSDWKKVPHFLPCYHTFRWGGRISINDQMNFPWNKVVWPFTCNCWIIHLNRKFTKFVMWGNFKCIINCYLVSKELINFSYGLCKPRAFATSKATITENFSIGMPILWNLPLHYLSVDVHSWPYDLHLRLYSQTMR